MLISHRAFFLSCGGALAALGASACFDWDGYDPRLHPAAAAGGTGADGAGGVGADGGTAAGGGTSVEGGSGGQSAAGGNGGEGGSEPCTGNAFECAADGSARECNGSAWQELGACPLGCDEQARACRRPSNVDAELFGAGDGAFDTEVGAQFVIDTDSGAITRDGADWRAAGEGHDSSTGIAFAKVDQAGGNPPLGIFSMASLRVHADDSVRAVGASALVLLVDGNAQIDGTLSVAADLTMGGPGGFPGGAPGTDGSGACAGRTGTGNYLGEFDNGYCTSGSSGAGFGAPGGNGGGCSCDAPDNYDGAPGGPDSCGTPELVPLVGGSGGAGGTLALNAGAGAAPGPGGGGGGALQLSAAGIITIGGLARINAGGGGGGLTVNGGGAGGGAGGALLFEAPTVTISVGAVLAANGGGGGGGDCL